MLYVEYGISRTGVFKYIVYFSILYIKELGLIRKPASFMTSICDERGQELLYAGIPITDIFKEDMGIGGVLSLLWFQRRQVLSAKRLYLSLHVIRFM